ncbi:LysE family translocator [Profundibacter sp.]|uniref:LysE family translocator n=1 Tax=Profundibacter sp. TaxID=3101071 RepID=UPI003D12B162
MTISAFIAVVLLHLMAAISPGPAVLMAARTGVTQGFAAGAALAVGIGVGGVIWAMAALFGLALLFEYAPMLLTGFKLIGGMFLIYMAYKLWKSADQPLVQTGPDTPPRSLRSAFLLGLVTQISNPKPAILFAAIFVGTVPATAGWGTYVALLAAVFFNETMWNTLVSRIFSLEKTRAGYLNLKGWIDRAFGGLLALLGVKIAAT